MPRPIGSYLSGDITTTNSVTTATTEWYTTVTNTQTYWLDTTTDSTGSSLYSYIVWPVNRATGGVSQGIGNGVPIVNLNIERGAVRPLRSAREEAEYEDRLEREARASREERIAVIDRAALLLKENLTREQLKEFEKDMRFTVRSQDGQRLYRINRGRVQNIEEVDDRGNRMSILCAHPVDEVPDFDTMLAQKLMLEHDEQAFLRLANRRTR